MGAMISPRRILLTGASGYVGGRLLTRLLGEGQAVRCLARAPGALSRRVGAGIEVVRGDLLDPGSLGSAFEGIDTAFYLVHSMGSGAGYAELDRRAAEVFGAAARRAGVRRIVYLGGLADPGAPLSRHLRSRLATGDHLRASGVPVTEFRASIVIGSGSLSFEMIRSLVERLPLMVWPRWVRTEAQPIGIDDLVTYLAAALDLPDDGANRVFEIGGADTASYGDLMREYARQRGLRRLIVPVPFLTPKISSLWLGLVTPVYARVGRELIDGVRNASVVGDRSALGVFPIRPAGYRQAMARALGKDAPETRWADARSSSRPLRTWPDARFSRRIIDVRERLVPLPCTAAFLPVQRIGGASGWYSPTASGRSAAGWIFWSAARACAAGGGIRRWCAWATRWTSGGSRLLSPDGGCVSRPRCGCPGGPGSSSRSNPEARAVCSDRRRHSIRSAWRGRLTGTDSTRSTP